MNLTITKKALLVLDVATPLLLVATSLAATFALSEILIFYDFYRPDPAFPIMGFYILCGLAFFVVTFLYLVWVTPTTLRLLVNLCFPSLIIIVVYLFDDSVQMQIGAGIGFIFWLGVLRFLLSKAMGYYACFWVAFGDLVFVILIGQISHPMSAFLISLLFVPHVLACIAALGVRDFWLSHLRPRAVSRGMSTRNIRFVEFYAPIIIAIAVFLPSLIYFVNSF